MQFLKDIFGKDGYNSDRNIQRRRAMRKQAPTMIFPELWVITSNRNILWGQLSKYIQNEEKRWQKSTNNGIPISMGCNTQL